MVDARSLHEWLGVGRNFPTWFRQVVRDYDFKEGADFFAAPARAAKGRGGSNRKDYLLTPVVGKEVAMIGNTPMGRATRRYFAKMEEAALKMAADHVAA